MDWNVKNAINRDVERQQLNKILRDIEQRLREVSERITSSGGSTDVRDLIGEMVSNNVERGINVTYDPVKKVLNFVVPPPPVVPAPEEPDVPDVDYVEEAPYDGAAYVRRDRAWEMLDNRIDSLSILEGPGLLAITSFDDWEVRVLLGVPGEIEITDGDGDEDNPTIGLADVTDSGEGALLAITRDSKGRVSGTKPATITGTADEIDVADGDAVDGLPTISLADLADAGGGEIRKFDRDSKGRVSGTSAATTDDLDEGSANLYYTDARADARISAQKGQPNGLASLDADAKLEANQLPALAITETFVVNDEAEMLALTAQQGDVAVRLDQEKSYILTVDPPSVLANWQELLFPTSAGGSVSSVGMSVPTGFTVSGSPITSSGTLSVNYDTGYQGYTSAEASKLSGIAAGATVGADWSVNLSNIPANIASWAAVSPSGFVDTSSNQTGLAGDKTWTGTHTFSGPHISGAAAALWFDETDIPKSWVLVANNNTFYIGEDSGAGANQRILIDPGARRLSLGTTTLGWGSDAVWHAGNFNPTLKADAANVWATVGSLLIPGITDFGVTDNSIPTGAYVAPFTASGLPVAANGMVYHGRRTAGGGEYQIYVGEDAANGLQWRYRVAGGWSGWRSVYHSANFNPASKADVGTVVTTSGNQSGLSGNKQWTGAHTFGAATVAGSNIVVYSAGNTHLWFRDGDNTTVRGLLYSDAATRRLALRAYSSGGPYTQLVADPSNNTWQIDGSEIWRTSNLADSGWIALSLNSGWSNAGSPYQTAAVRKFGNFVKLRGTINQGSSTAFTLPSGYRPQGETQFCLAGNDSFPTIVRVQANGQVSVLFSGPGSTRFSLDGISFYTD